MVKKSIRFIQIFFVIFCILRCNQKKSHANPIKIDINFYVDFYNELNMKVFDCKYEFLFDKYYWSGETITIKDFILMMKKNNIRINTKLNNNIEFTITNEKVLMFPLKMFDDYIHTLAVYNRNQINIDNLKNYTGFYTKGFILNSQACYFINKRPSYHD